MKKHLLPCLMVLALAASCSSKDDPKPDPQPAGETWYLHSMDELFQNDVSGPENGDNYRIAYNADSSVSHIYLDTIGVENKSELAVYEEYSFHHKNGKLERISVKYSNNSVWDVNTYVWNTAGQIAEINGSLNRKLFYDNEGRLTRQEFWAGVGTDRPYIHHQLDYTWKDGNVTVCKFTSIPEVKTFEMTYTNRKRSVTGASMMMDLLYEAELLSDWNMELGMNELATVTVKDADGRVARSKKYTYTYNERGQRATMKTEHLRANGTLDFSYTYTYNYKKH